MPYNFTKICLYKNIQLQTFLLSDFLFAVQPTGSIAISTAPNLPARYLFCFRLVNGDGGASQLKYVKACLQQCSKMRVRSAAFPALGTGRPIRKQLYCVD